MLSESDLLRLNVLMSQTLEAVRINEGRMQLEALTPQGEASVPLHATGRAESYLKEVRAWLSTQVLGSPGGYPLYIRRWTRMGQARDGSLERLLLLGDPEAVAAVVHAPGLTSELARRAWWIEPRAEHARCMLKHLEIANSPFGKVLSEFLLEFLPFEEEPRDVVASLKQLLRHDNLVKQHRAELWQRAQRQSAYAAGFLAAGRSYLPIERKAHSRYQAALANPPKPGVLAGCLEWALSARGQTFLATARMALKRPPNQDVTVEIFNAINVACALPGIDVPQRSFEDIEEQVRKLNTAYDYGHDPEWQAMRHALMCLAHVNESLLDPIFGITDAVGSVMRKRIEPVVRPLLTHINTLLDDA